MSRRLIGEGSCFLGRCGHCDLVHQTTFFCRLASGPRQGLTYGGGESTVFFLAVPASPVASCFELPRFFSVDPVVDAPCDRHAHRHISLF